MSRIFVISGSRSINELPYEVYEVLDRIIQGDYQVYIGDAPGVDSLVQQYLVNKYYTKVTVWGCSKGIRTCLFPDYVIVPGDYSDRDNEMFTAAKGNFHLAIWEGKSKGTYSNLSRKDLIHKLVTVD